MLAAVLEAVQSGLRLRRLTAGPVLCFLALYAIAIASAFARSAAPESWSLHPVVSYTSFALLMGITVVLVNSRARLRNVLLVALGSVALGSVYVLREWQKYRSVYSDFRPGYVVGDPNYFSASALLCIPLGICLFLYFRSGWRKYFCAVCLVLTILALTACASRGGFLGLVLAGGVLLLHMRRRVAIASAVCAVILPLNLLSPNTPLRRLLQPTHSDARAADNRTAAWVGGWNMIQAEPLFGVGLGNFKSLSTRYEDPDNLYESVAHNAYIEIAAELGIPALLLFIGIIAWCLLLLQRVLKKAVRRQDGLVRAVAIGMQAGITGFAASLVFVSGQYQKLFWFMVFLSACLSTLVRRRRMEAA
jgi:O-antigen ligase